VAKNVVEECALCDNRQCPLDYGTLMLQVQWRAIDVFPILGRVSDANDLSGHGKVSFLERPVRYQ